jgi:hypothetical protein
MALGRRRGYRNQDKELDSPHRRHFRLALLEMNPPPFQITGAQGHWVETDHHLRPSSAYRMQSARCTVSPVAENHLPLLHDIAREFFASFIARQLH